MKFVRIRSFSTVSAEQEPRLNRNPIGIQLLNTRLQSKIFPPEPNRHPPSKRHLQLAEQHLRKHKLWGKSSSNLPDINADLIPPLIPNAKNIYEHFQLMAEHTHRGYFDLARRFCFEKLPRVPSDSQWDTTAPGWMRYDQDSGIITRVSYPLEDALVFDVEVLMRHSKYPILATAASSKAWYSWLSPVLFHSDDYALKPVDFEHLVPLGRKAENRLVIGHHVSFDRSRVLEEYSIQAGKIRYMDTMSLHVAVCGLTTQQRNHWMKIDKELKQSHDATDSELSQEDLDWYAQSSLNSLKDIAKFHLDLDMDKSARDVFIEGDLASVKDELRSLLSYCANDVSITHQVYQKLFPKFMSRKISGNMASFAGMLDITSAYLPVSQKWNQYIANCENLVFQNQSKVDSYLLQIADEYLKMPVTLRTSDPYLRQLCWNPATKRGPYVPKWYRSLIPSKKKEPEIKIKSKIAPILLRLTWMGYPLFYLGRSYGWCYRVPKADVDKFKLLNPIDIQEYKITVEEEKKSRKSGESSEEFYLNLVMEDGNDFTFFRLPSRQGADQDANCGSPFAKSFVNAFSDGTLDSAHAIAKEAIKYNAACSYWISSRERIKSQFVVPQDKYVVILPNIVPMGTITRRAVESTWLTASNAKVNRIGSELKSMVQAPEGYCIVGADVDSQELWIASLLGDSQFGIHGATALGYMTLQGNKADGTDLHSRSASILGATRDQAKVFNYARIYGSGINFAAELLCNCDSSISKAEAMQRAKALFANTKGVKRSFKSSSLTSSYAGIWKGGSESYTFNKLEEIAFSADPRTPVFGCQLPDSLISMGIRKRYSTSSVNWVVQSSGVDYLHALITSMNYLTDLYKIDCRLLITIHDEIRYLVREDDGKRAALALQISNLWTRSLFAYQAGMNDLPLSVAFFSSVDVDKVLRKETFDKCITPTMPDGIDLKGKSFTIYDLQDVTLGEAVNQVKEMPSYTAAVASQETSSPERLLSQM